jgi:general secretion pathway protein L
MTIFPSLGAILNAWTGSIAGGLIAALSRFMAPRMVRLVEADDGRFVVEAAGKADDVPSTIALTDGAAPAGLASMVRGSRVEIVLQPKRFLFRPLELPARAADFIEGIVRAQIDRLTPWNASEAVFGCTVPTASGGESITTTVAATTRKAVAGYLQAVSAFRPSAVAICTDVAEAGGARVKVFEQSAFGSLGVAKLSRALQLALGAVVIITLIAVAASTWVASSVGAQEDELARQISERRAAIRAGAGDGDRSPVALLERRKYQTPASVIVLETLSKVLPDNTYVTELHLTGNKLQIAGITTDAPSLIPLIEQSSHFTRATFYAPTTRSPSDPGERFHIEAQVKPANTVAP